MTNQATSDTQPEHVSMSQAHAQMQAMVVALVACSRLDASGGICATILTTYLGSSFFIPDTIAVRILCD